MSVLNTFLGTAALTALLQGRQRLWFIGIGGVQMSALALFCRAQGFEVSGSDTVASDMVKHLQKEGIRIWLGHHPQGVADVDAVIYTLAINTEDPEYLAAIRLGLPMISRADLLGYLTHVYPNRIGVAGSHGKSTVTAMLGHIFEWEGRDPTVFCGAKLPSGETVRHGQGKDAIFEACEYGNSFLSLSPTVSIILNTDFDHADFFEDEKALRTSFLSFAARADTLVCETQDTDLAIAHPHARTFGLYSGNCHTADLQYHRGRGSFSLTVDNRHLGHVCLAVPGEHNVKNALAAALCAIDAGIRPSSIIHALNTFQGVARRMSYRGLFHGAHLFDDYAHHPTEIRASLLAARAITHPAGRLFAVFQPHTYTRTKAFFDEFCTALRPADRVIIADIYPARETDPLGMSASLLAEEIGTHAAYVGDFPEIARTLIAEIAPGDTVLVMGAGDVDRLFAQFCAKHFTLS